MPSLKFTHDDINRLRAEAMQQAPTQQNQGGQKRSLMDVIQQLKGIKKVK